MVLRFSTRVISLLGKLGHDRTLFGLSAIAVCLIKPRGEGGRIPIPVRICLMVGIDQTCLPATQSGGGVRMPCKGGGSGLDGIARRLGGPDGVLVVFSPRVVVLPDLRPSICGRQSASVPRAAAARAAAWHPSSVSNLFIMAWGSAGCPVSASNTRMYPAVPILKQRAAAGEWIQSSERPY